MNSIFGMGSGMTLPQSFSKPDPTQAAQQLFAELDSSGKGYLEKSDLQSAFEKVSAVSDETNIDELYAQLDSDNDGMVTEQEFTDTLSEIDQQARSLIAAMRMNEAMGAMPPPPPPDGAEDEGFTIDELSAQLEEIEDTDSERASLISSIIENFDTADTDDDGKVSREEAMAYGGAGANEQAMGTMPPPPPPPGSADETGFTLEELTAQLEEIGDSDSERASLISNIIDNFDAADTDGDGRVSMVEAMAFDQENSTTAADSASASEDQVSARVLLQIMQLMEAYSIGNNGDSDTLSSISLSV